MLYEVITNNVPIEHKKTSYLPDDLVAILYADRYNTDYYSRLTNRVIPQKELTHLIHTFYLTPQTTDLGTMSVKDWMACPLPQATAKSAEIIAQKESYNFV